jgi:hypothetical protein
MSESVTYIKAQCCNEDCYAIDNEEPCWGDTQAIDEEYYGDDDYYWVHACEGHQDKYHGGDYIEEEQ